MVCNCKALENIGAIGWRITEEEVKQLDAVAVTSPETFWQEK